MPFDTPILPLTARVAQLNKRFRNQNAADVLKHALCDPRFGRVAMVSSFGAESMVLLHLIAQIDRNTPVLFIDTELLFDETLIYQQDLSKQLGLSNIQVLRPNQDQMSLRNTDGLLHKKDPDACCTLRKTEPLQNALAHFDAWITGRKRFQGQKRTNLEFFENEADKRIKVNPLAHWSPKDVQDYITKNSLPRHPLVVKGYLSIGCAPCTSPVVPGGDSRAGRWPGKAKGECGIHILDGKIMRGPQPQGAQL